jgi:pantothenate kinase type III
VSTNQEQEALLAKIWETVPSRFFVMKGDDFFNKDEGRYDTMGTDRLATLTGAVHLHGHPSLVFDGGTATTYSATDGSGRIMGGGIGPGIQSKFRSLRTDTSALPEISSEEVISRVKEAQESGKPLPTFARNTQEAMMVDAFQEFALKGRNVIEHWLEKAFKKSMSTTSATSSGGTKVNSGKRVLCTGGDGDLLMQLLQPHHGGLIEQVESDRALSNGVSVDLRYEVDSSKHLIHYGIACVLLKQSKLSKQQHKELKIHETLQDNVETRKLDALNEYVGKREAKSKRSKLSKQQHKELKIHETLQDNVETRKLDALNEYVGKRVAKRFNVETDDGDKIFRGIVMKVIEIPGAESEFLIKYDDGDGEDVTMDELLSE